MTRTSDETDLDSSIRTSGLCQVMHQPAYHYLETKFYDELQSTVLAFKAAHYYLPFKLNNQAYCYRH